MDRGRQPGWPHWIHAVSGRLATRRESQAAVKQIRRELGSSRVHTIDGLVDHVAERRGKPITVVRIDMPDTISAFSLATKDRDYIAVDKDDAPLSQVSSTVHELGHFLYDDRQEGVVPVQADGASPLPRDLAVRLTPALNPDEVSAYFMRSHYDSPVERAVETFATVALERMIALRAPDKHGFRLTFTHRSTGV